MLFFGDLTNKELSEKIGLKTYYPKIDVFPDGEMRVRIENDVCDQEVAILKSLCSPVNDNIVEFCLTIDALKRSGAKKIMGIISYMSYARADHIFKTGEGVPLETVIRMLEASGLDETLVIDPHSIKMGEMFQIPVKLESALPLFAEKIKSLNLSEYTIVSPDMGGIRRIKILSELLDNADYAVVEKERDLETGHVEAKNIEGKIHETAIIVDDMISTGKTIVEAIKVLKEKGARRIFVFATHAIFSDDAPKILQESDAEKVFVTDTIFTPLEKRFEKLEILSVSETISNSLKE